MSRVLVVAAHPDDEVLGCGATIAKHASRGDTVEIVIVAEGAAARGFTGKTLQDQKDLLRASAKAAARAVGAVPPHHLDFPDNRLDSIDMLDLVQALEDQIGRVQPDVIYTHHAGDLNIDHRRVHQAVVTAARPLPGRKGMSLFAYETVSSTEWALAGPGCMFEPTVFVDVSEYLPAKLEALQCYESEMHPFPHPRSVEAIRHLGALRGSQIGRSAAEAFVSIRQMLEFPQR